MISLRTASTWPDDALMFFSAHQTITTFAAERHPQLEVLANRIPGDPRLQQTKWYGRGDPSLLYGSDARLDLAGFLRQQRALIDRTAAVAEVLRAEG